MTKEQWAAKLNGREYREELDDAENEQAKADGVLIIFGASDDLIEFRGVIYNEVGAYNGRKIAIVDGELFIPDDGHRCDCDHCGYNAAAKRAAEHGHPIDAIWDTMGYSWYINSPVAHSAFDILEDGEKYCRGLVLDARDVAKGL